MRIAEQRMMSRYGLGNPSNLRSEIAPAIRGKVWTLTETGLLNLPGWCWSLAVTDD